MVIRRCALPELDFLRLTEPCVAQHFVLTRAFLDKLADDLEAPSISHVGRPELAVGDPMLAAFGRRLQLARRIGCSLSRNRGLKAVL
jgi:hypothetical protein